MQIITFIQACVFEFVFLMCVQIVLYVCGLKHTLVSPKELHTNNCTHLYI